MEDHGWRKLIYGSYQSPIPSVSYIMSMREGELTSFEPGPVIFEVRSERRIDWTIAEENATPRTWPMYRNK